MEDILNRLDKLNFRIMQGTNLKYNAILVGEKEFKILSEHLQYLFHTDKEKDKLLFNNMEVIHAHEKSFLGLVYNA
jgi:hypothetical protein